MFQLTNQKYFTSAHVLPLMLSSFLDLCRKSLRTINCYYEFLKETFPNNPLSADSLVIAEMSALLLQFIKIFINRLNKNVNKIMIIQDTSLFLC